MEAVPLSWLILAAISPLAAVLSAWTLFIFHTYRRRWRTVDLFLVGCVVGGLLTCILYFTIALHHLFTSGSMALCSLFTWASTAVRTLQVTLLTSLVIDRTLTVKWPYRYRFSVRQNQIRYHLGVVGVVAVLIGGASVFARSASSHCSILLVGMDFKFAVFLIGLHVLLVLANLVGIVQVQVHGCRSRHRMVPFLPEMVMTKTSHPPSGRTTSKRPYTPDSGSTHIRWEVVMSVTGLAYIVNHLPYLIISIVITFVVPISSPWLENAVAWLAVIEALLLPAVLCLSDSFHFRALVSVFRSSNTDADDLFGAEDGHFRYANELTESRVAPRGLFSNNIPSVGVPGPPGTKLAPFPLTSAASSKQTTEYCWADIFKRSNGEDFSEPVYTDPLSLSDSIVSDLDKCGQDDASSHIYATLSEKLGSTSSISEDDDDEDDESLGGSVAADDDFIFHRTTASVPTETKLPNASSTSDLGHDSPQNTLSSQATTASLHSDDGSSRQKWRNSSSSIEELDLDHTNESTDKIWKTPLNKASFPKLSRNTSLSMNDIDQVTQMDDRDDEVVYILPIKSESMMSLYKIYFEHENNKSPCKTISEGDLSCSADQSIPVSTAKDSLNKSGRNSFAAAKNNVAKRLQWKERERRTRIELASRLKNPICVSGDSQRQYAPAASRKTLKVSFVDRSDSSKKIVTLHNPKVASVKELLGILDKAKFSYLDNGDLCWHYIFDGNESEVKKVFVSEYI